MDTDHEQNASEAAGARSAVPKSASRRRLLQAGLSATPAILTIVSEPVRAFNGTAALPCRSASAFASVAAAQHAGAVTSASPQQSCLGLSPASWNSLSASGWPVAQGTLFSSVFAGGYTLRGNASPTFKDILNLDATTKNFTAQELMARNFVAAYLNLQSAKTPDAVVNLTQLTSMWQLAVAGSYRPTATAAVWTTTDINNWFAQTFAG